MKPVLVCASLFLFGGDFLCAVATAAGHATLSKSVNIALDLTQSHDLRFGVRSQLECTATCSVNAHCFGSHFDK